LLTAFLAILHGRLNPITDGLASVIAVIAVALLGGLAPAVFEAITGSLLLNFRFLLPTRTFTVAAANDAVVLSVLIAVAVVVSLLAGKAVRHAGQAAAATAAAEPIAEADRMRTVLLAAVSHDLRTPLAAAKAAVACLRCHDIQLTAEDHGELLATADESLDLLTRLVASLLDVSRLQAGALPVFPRPADLGEIVERSLDAVGPQARAVRVGVPRELPQVMVDPASAPPCSSRSPPETRTIPGHPDHSQVRPDPGISKRCGWRAARDSRAGSIARSDASQGGRHRPRRAAPECRAS
jgi:two-component system, OmpR family, sensor histidine kinase KdpD